MKDINVLIVGHCQDKNCPLDNLKDSSINFEVAGSISEAKSLIKDNIYDCVISHYHLKDGLGTDLRKIYPEYRIILVGIKKDLISNGFFEIYDSVEKEQLLHNINQIVQNNPSNKLDTAILIMGLSSSIQNIQNDINFIKSNFKEIHSKLNDLEEKQKTLNFSFSEFEKQKNRNEQFYINSLLEVKEKLNNGN